jgi:isoleucyl-tRNA synthetase
VALQSVGDGLAITGGPITTSGIINLTNTGVTKINAGTGIVHCAPGFGEDDYQVCLANGLVTPGNVVMPIDDDGNFKNVVSDYKGMNFKAI